MRVILYMAMTANGMIARENDETPWSDAEWESFKNMVKRTKNIVIGRRTYEIMGEKGEFESIGNPFVAVVSGSGAPDRENIIFVRSPEEAVELLKKKGFAEALVCGGGRLNASFMKGNLIDDIYLDIEPVVFGKGIKLFADEDFEARLELVETEKLSENVMQLHYRVVK